MDKKEAAYLLQRVDCNCNDCGFMKRDLEKFNYWKKRDHEYQIEYFTRLRERLKERAGYWLRQGQEQKAMVLMDEARNMKFQYQSRPSELHYGHCMKFNKPVIFMPGYCQVDTQKCFIHRKDYIHEPTKNQDHE